MLTCCRPTMEWNVWGGFRCPSGSSRMTSYTAVQSYMPCGHRPLPGPRPAQHILAHHLADLAIARMDIALRIAYLAACSAAAAGGVGQRPTVDLARSLPPGRQPARRSTRSDAASGRYTK